MGCKPTRHESAGMTPTDCPGMPSCHTPPGTPIGEQLGKPASPLSPPANNMPDTTRDPMKPMK